MAKINTTFIIILIVLTMNLVSLAQIDPNKIIDKSKFVPKGNFIEVNAPDTLDLAERAKYALNYMVNNVEPNKACSLYHVFQFDSNPPIPSQLTWNLPVKVLRSFPWVRTMTGSDEKLDIEAAIMNAYLKQIDDRGIVRYPYGGEGVPEGTSYAYTQGMLALAIDNWYLRDHNKAWFDWIHQIANGLKIMAIRVEDRAYYPPESGYKTDGSWHWTTRAGANPFMPYTPPEEPQFEQQGYEGIAKYDQTSPLRALLKDSIHNKDAKSMELVQCLIRFMMKPGMWKDTTSEGYLGFEKGVWEGHFHGNLIALHGLTEYAVATDNDYLKQIMRQAYDRTIKLTTFPMGWSPFWVPPGGFNRPKYISGWCDTCNVADTIVMAVKLSDAGLGDYWDDVDKLLRNQLVEQQICDLELMRKTGAGDKNDALLKKFWGGFGGLEVTRAKPLLYGCCSANGPMGLYYAWHGITRFDNGVATVNLFLNRVSDWMDIFSYLPYEGKVELYNKKANTALIRIPSWLNSNDVKSAVNNKSASPAKVENYLVFNNLKENDKIVLTFPVKEYKEKHTIYGTEFTMTVKGSTVVDISPRDYPPVSQTMESYKKMYPVYQRDFMKTDKAPIKKAKMFVAEKPIPLQ